MALAGDTQQTSVLVVQSVGVQNSAYMAGEHRAEEDRAEGDRAEGDTESTPFALADIHSWRDTGFLGKQKVRTQLENTY